MGTVLAVVCAAAVLALLTVGFGSIIKAVAFGIPTQDGDTLGNRMSGHGPDDEVFLPSAREQMRSLNARLREPRPAESDVQARGPIGPTQEQL